MSAGASLVQGAGSLFSANALRSAALSAGRTLAARAIANVLDDRNLEGPRLSELRLQTSTEGAHIPLTWGATRLAGQVIWAARFLEHKTEREADGGKGGGPSVTEYDYSLSFAVGLCEGEIVGLGRVWANGEQINLSDYNYRLYRGGAAQEPDPLIQAVQGAEYAPAYRGLAYIVFEDMPLDRLGDRMPQLAFEVIRRPKSFAGEAPLDQLVRAVDLIPASGEFAYATEAVFKKNGPGALAPENVRNAQAQPDILVALDNLQADAPNCDFVWLVTGWFGDDLRAGVCQIKPGVETAYKNTTPVSWSVAGTGRSGAHLVSQQDGAAIYGGTPSDRSVIQTIQALKARGFKVGLYPFILMDVAADNEKPDPYGGAQQAAFPWRGRITCHPAAGQSGAPDNSGAATAQINDFFGAAQATDFSVSPDNVAYAGPDEWRYNRFILHYAALAQAAGGVDAFLIGSEMRGITRVRSGRNSYPAIAKLRTLAAQTRALLSETKILYAADWSEYGAHNPSDGSGDLGFPLDALFADSNIDAVGLDWYAPLTDWRDHGANADAANARDIYDPDYLQSRIESGEDYEWYYASDADRIAQIRTPITDDDYNKPWVHRTKDIRAWWSNAHVERLGGIEQPSPTAWVPQSKPIWFTELGCPAADKGSNQPNVFYDPKSSESALPRFSSGARDDLIQRRMLEAYLRYWADAARNPASSIYDGRMIATDRTALWCWDSRPYPDFPARNTVWGDAANWRLGHWLTGRLGLAPLADVVIEICRRAGLDDIDASSLDGVVSGFALNDPTSARQALTALCAAYGFDLIPRGDGLAAIRHGGAARAGLSADDLALNDAKAPRFERTRLDPNAAPLEARVRFYDPSRDYMLGAVSARRKDAAQEGVVSLDLPLSLDGAQAEAIAWRALAEARAARDQVDCALPARLLHLSPGDVVVLNLDGPEGLSGAAFQIDSLVEGPVRRARLIRAPDAPNMASAGSAPGAGAPAPVFTPPEIALIDAPFARGAQDWQILAAARAEPWPGALRAFAGPSNDALRLIGRVEAPAAMGELLTDLPAGRFAIWQEDAELRLTISGVSLQSATKRQVLNGANLLAVESPYGGGWEFLQFRDAELVGAQEWRLSGLLRGQFGTDDQARALIPAGGRVVLMDDRIAKLALAESERGLLLQWRVGPAGRDRFGESYAALESAKAGRALRPWSPCHLRATRQPGGDIRISWVRRARWGGDSCEGLDPPLSEEAEIYQVSIFASGILKRRLESAAPEATYALSAQISDLGGSASALELEVVQLSNRAGAGISRSGLIAVN